MCMYVMCIMCTMCVMRIMCTVCMMRMMTILRADAHEATVQAACGRAWKSLEELGRAWKSLEEQHVEELAAPSRPWLIPG